MKKINLLVITVICFLLASVFVTAAVPQSPDVGMTLMSQSPDPVEPGQIVKVKFKVENEGSETPDDVIVRVLPKYPFTIYGDDEEKNIGKLRSSSTGADSVEVTFQLKVDDDAVEAETELELEIKITEGATIKYTNNEFTIDIQTHDAVLDITGIEIDPEQVAPGDTANVKISVRNEADSLLKDIIFKLEMSDGTIPFAPYQSSSEKRISQLNSGYQNSLNFEIIVSPDADAGLYKIPLNISYNDEQGNSYTHEDLLAIQVGKTPVLKAYVKKTEILQAGQAGKVTLEIANSDIVNVNNLELELIESSEYQLVSPSNYFYLGDLDADDTESEEINIYVPEDLEEVSIPIKLTYMDDNNQEYQQNFNLDLNLYSSSELKKLGLTQSSSAGYWVIIVILIIAGVGYYIYKKRKKKNQKND
ncbi:MAG: hypothetical protein ABIG93_02625 [archaeon]|nr:hypothetical protein [Nanoarchaeota archaeon]